MSVALVLFRRDLRLDDHPALEAACAAHDRVLAVFIHAPEETAPWSPGAASRWWLHHSLVALDTRLREQDGRLFIAAGETLPVVRKLLQRCGATAVYWSRRYEPAAIAHDKQLKQALRADGVVAESRPSNLWCEPWQLTTAGAKPYRVFTPFWRKLRAEIPLSPPSPTAHAHEWVRLSGSLDIGALGLLPSIPWDQGISETWQPGEAGAAEMLELFADDALAGYKQMRDFPDRHGTSQLSPHLHFGEITPRQIRHRLRVLMAREGAQHHLDLEPYLRELAWREFAYHLLYHFPASPTENLNPRFDGFRWASDDPEAIGRWQRGQTGVPLVDAGMRELWHTGWMHNRVRMVAASFLTKNLRQHWHHGARWFWDTLVDADLANNTLGWQWVAGCGADAAPYFRVFNPYTQAKKFDPDGAYIRRWVPELAKLPVQLIHEPRRDPTALAACGYPMPMVDVGASREAALAAYAAIKAQ
ncbi:MAG: deoxyribodipyrimidine photo-lyase [Nevskiaceae bacterium]|nr:MAG: deoxyribodipyrimidine photo-lyase [Nevskiaceae bacterium]TBR71675.1 MAG: deoxyribodipyrimidine photo-lyase [Nevskiaceae bacterium]